MLKNYLLLIYFSLLLFLVSGCFKKEIKEGCTDEEMLNYLKDKYGIEFQIIDYKREVKYAKEESYDYYYKTWKVSPKDKEDLIFNVTNDMNKAGRRLVLKDEYSQRLFYYYLEQSDIHYCIEGEETDSVISIYFKSKDDISLCIKETCDVIQKVLEDSSYQYKASEDREVVSGLKFAVEGYDSEYQCPGFFLCHRLVLKKDTVVDTNTKYEISKGTYDGLFGPYDDEQYNKPMDLDEILRAWEQIVSDEYDRYYHDKPYIDEARKAALKELEAKGYIIKYLNFSGAFTWDGLWDGDLICFGGLQADGSYISLDVKYVNGEWKVKITYKN